MKPYAELQTTSNFSFLRGASHPEELVSSAAERGLSAIAITDRNTLAGVVRAHLAAREKNIKLIIGARLDFTDAPSLLCLPMNKKAYSHLSQLITLGRRRAPKGACNIKIDDFLERAKGQIVISLATPLHEVHLHKLSNALPGHSYLSGQNFMTSGAQKKLATLQALSKKVSMPLVATNDVHYHKTERRDLQDILTSIRIHRTIREAGYHLFPNAERHIKSGAEMTILFRQFPKAIKRTIEIARRCTFSLDELVYEYPDDEAPDGISSQKYLERLTWNGAKIRYRDNIPKKVGQQLTHELALIDELNYANYFLTVYDIVNYANRMGILCQGRGSAANSAVCYCLGITAIDPVRIDLLFERFISAERGEPPDIDVDFEHERREEVIQYIYEKYGRDRAGLAATIVHYRGRNAMREVSRAMGLTRDIEETLAGTISGRRSGIIDDHHIREAGLDPNEKNLSNTLRLAREIIGFPRHLSQHVGGFVITRNRLDAMVPITNAAMDDRTTIEWDKDDLDALGILKIDVLGLGMLSCIRKALSLLKTHYGKTYQLSTIPAEDSAVYDMLCKADSVGVFQVESRAQMSMLPRLKPRNFYDLVIEIAIVRPGPIQGDMVHPYLRRRNGQEKIEYHSEDLRAVLEKTYGVPLFQEQAMKIAIVAAGFTPSEADGLRRAMATFRHLGTINNYHDKMVRGMVSRNYDPDFAERCFKQIKGFGDYGFPESHAASFALLVYVSSWLKCHYPAAFACALLNSQPMGFYAPAQIIRDAQEHGVIVQPVDINFSDWDCTLETGENRTPSLRIGFRQVKGLKKTDANTLLQAREAGNARPFSSPEDLWTRSKLNPKTLECLAKADAYKSVGLSRRQALWDVRRINPNQLPLFIDSGENIIEPKVELPTMHLGEEVTYDYAATRMSLKAHPLQLLRVELDSEGVIPASQIKNIKNGKRVSVTGLVINRQRPSTASGIIFTTLEDETGVSNVIIWPKLFQKYRKETLESRLLYVTGELQREGLVTHIIAKHLVNMTERLTSLVEVPLHFENKIKNSRSNEEYNKIYPSRDFH
ncbi:MAG: error-prone DNA polymerase [Rhodospirillaceae bacterium]|nr:error-prone DNA polymerase [Rhodospirillaceae bacterium]